jgi:hypothetical protein
MKIYLKVKSVKISGPFYMNTENSLFYKNGCMTLLKLQKCVWEQEIDTPITEKS